MNLTNIETFLCVAKNQSLSLASSLLYISQPTVSARLQQLEEDLGVTLLIRKKGVRSIELTPQGMAFIPLAERWVALGAETDSFSATQFLTPFSIASPDSLNYYLFQPLFKKLTAPECALALRVRTHQSPEIFSLIENNEADAGFVFHVTRSANVVCRPLFSEKMVLLCSAYGQWPDTPIAPDALDPHHEVFISWSQDIQMWHDSWWGPTSRPYVHLDNASLITLYMDNPHCWALCPMSVANMVLQQGSPVEPHELSSEPPERTCYYLTCRSRKSSAAAAARQLFQNSLYEHLAARPELVNMAPDAADTLLGK